MKVVLAIFQRNVASYFSGVLGYLFIIVFVVLSAILAFNEEFFANNLANLDQLNQRFPFLLLFIVPAITMSIWADEKKVGTDELLFTLPAKDIEVLLAKYLAVLTVYSIALGFCVFQLFVLAWYADPDWGMIFTTYLGYWLAGAALLGAGMFASLLTSSVTVAFVLGAAMCAIPVIMNYLTHDVFQWVLMVGGALVLAILLVVLTAIAYRESKSHALLVAGVPLTGLAIILAPKVFNMVHRVGWPPLYWLVLALVILILAAAAVGLIFHGIRQSVRNGILLVAAPLLIVALIVLFRPIEEVNVFRGHGANVNAVAVSPDGSLIVSGSDDDTAVLWDADTGRLLARLEKHSDAVNAVAFGDEGSRIATAGADGRVMIWETKTDSEESDDEEDEQEKQEPLREIRHTGNVTCVAFSPDGKQVASGGDDQKVKIWNTKSAELVQTLDGHEEEILSLAYSPDGKQLAIGDADGTIKIWNVEDGKELKTLYAKPADEDEKEEGKSDDEDDDSEKLPAHSGDVTALAFSPDGGRLVSGSADKSLKLWDVEEGEEVFRCTGHTEAVTAVSFDPGGGRFASSGRDETVRLWDAENGQESARLQAHAAVASSVAFNSDGDRLASAGWDERVRLWNVSALRTGLPLVPRGWQSTATHILFFLLIPIYVVFYCLTRWKEAGSTFWAFLAAYVCLVLGFFFEIVPQAPWDRFVQALSVSEQLRDFTLGVIPGTGVIYFVSLTALMLYLNYVLMTRRHWSASQAGNMGLQFIVRSASVATILISLNVVAAASTQVVNLSADLTAEQIYSLTPTTEEIIDNIEDEYPVTIEAFISPEVPRELVPLRKKLVGLLRQYDRLGGGNIQVRFVDVPSPTSEEAEEADLRDITSRVVFTEDRGRRREEEVFMGVVVSSSYDEVVIPYFDPGMSVEYELTRSIRTVTDQERLSVGILRTDASVMGGFDSATFRSTAQWQIVQELRRQYDVDEASPDEEILYERFDLDEELQSELKEGTVSDKLREEFDRNDISLSAKATLKPVKEKKDENDPDVDAAGEDDSDDETDDAEPEVERWILKDPANDRGYVLKKGFDDYTVYSYYDVLLAVLPSSLTDPQMANLINYVKTGRPVLIFDDPMPVTIGLQLAPREQKPRQGGMMGQGPPPVPKADGGRLTRLLDVLQVDWNYDEIAWDTFNPHPKIEELVRPELVWITPKSGTDDAFNPHSPITGPSKSGGQGLQELLAFFPGTVSKAELRDGDDNKVKFQPLLKTGPRSGLLPWDRLVVQQHPLFGGVRLREERELEVMGAYRMDPFSHALGAHVTSNEGNGLNVVFVADIDCISDQMFGIVRNQVEDLVLDNVTFVLNAVDVLAGDNSYLPLRKRRTEHRTLAEIQRQTEAFRREKQKAIEKAEEDANRELEKRRASFQRRKEAIEQDESLTPREKEVKKRIAEDNEQQQMTVAQVNIESEKEKRIDRQEDLEQRQIENLENEIWLRAILLPPLPAVLLGLMVWGFRLYKERKEIDPGRLRQH